MKLITLENLKSFWKDVKSYVDNGLSKKADSVHGTHVTYGTINGKAPGTPSAGTSSKVAREDHVHPVQTTISGNAGTATKLQTARTITLKGRANGSASFDGSGNIIIDTNPKMFESGGTSGTSGYVAVAQLKITGSYANRPTEFKLVSRGRGTTCTVSVAFVNTDSTDPSLSSIRYWGTDYGVFIHKSTTSTWLLYATKSEAHDSIAVVDCCYGSQSITITYPGSFITEKPTSNITNASLGGSFGQANTANSATKATQDSAGQQINTTYIKGLSVNGKTITYTKGDGSTGTITTQDTNTDTNTTYTLSKSGSTITLTGSDGKTTSVSDSNTTYSTGTTSASGLTKLYTATGTATDGTLTQKAITDALKGKSDTTHTHSYLPLSGGTLTGDTTFDKYIKLNAWPNYGTGTANLWYDANNKTLAIENATNLTLGGTAVSKNGHTHNYLPLGGGTVNSSNFGPLVIKRNATTAASITFSNNNGILGHIGMTNSPNGGLIRWSSDASTSASGTAYTVLDTGNYKNTVTPANIGAAAASHTHNYVPTSDYSLTTISKTLTLTTSWQDTGITGSNLSTGTYIVQVSGMNAEATSFYQEIWSGTMSWFQGTTNSTDSDEIILHKAGHASNGRTIYLRTIRTSNSGYLKLQIASSHALSSSNITFKFRKLI